ncbi:10062_t:CDS:2, partial [Scutellospora calospora]
SSFISGIYEDDDIIVEPEYHKSFNHENNQIVKSEYSIQWYILQNSDKIDPFKKMGCLNKIGIELRHEL